MGTLAVETKPLHGIKRVPQCNCIGLGRQYNIGEKPSVILYTYINLHAGTPQPQSFLSKSYVLQCSNMVLYGLREIKVKLYLSEVRSRQSTTSHNIIRLLTSSQKNLPETEDEAFTTGHGTVTCLKNRSCLRKI